MIKKILKIITINQLILYKKKEQNYALFLMNKITKIIIKPEKSKEDIEKEKKMKKGKYTYDCQGNIIFIRDIRQDYLSKEFWPITSKQKDIKPGKTSDECKKELIKMENNAQKNIEYNDNDKN